MRSASDVTTRCEGIGTGLHPVLISIEVSQLVLHEADLPDLVVDFADAPRLRQIAQERAKHADRVPKGV